MEQSTGFPATTIHKALGLLAGEDGDYCEPEMLDADLIVVDEVSMMDIYLANHLFRSVPHGQSACADWRCGSASLCRARRRAERDHRLRRCTGSAAGSHIPAELW